MKREELIRTELQMITGVITSDLDYLLYLTLKGGTFFAEDSEVSSKFVKLEDSSSVEVVTDLETWFKQL